MLLLASGSVGFVGQLHSGHFILARRAALGNNVNNVFSIVRMLSISAALLLTGDPVVIASLVFSLSVFNNLIIVLLARHLLKVDGQYVTDQTARSVEQWWSTARIILKKGLSFFTIGSIWQVILFQGITLVVRIAMGPESVALFNTLRMLSRSVNQFISMIYATIFPELQAELCSGNIDRGGKLFRLAVGSSVLLGISGFFVLAVFGVPFYKFWTRSELSVPILAWFILIAGIPFNSLWWTMSMVFRAVNQPERVAHILLPCAIAAVGITWLLIGQFGVYAPITASLLFDVAVFLLILPPVSKIVNCSPAALLLDSFFEVFKALRTAWHMVKSASLN
jgi:O-antigen/teichoic acid export membrane protein